MVGTATADSSGNWTLTVTTSLTDGTHMATALARDAAGNASPSSTAVSFTVDTAPPAAPVVVLPANASTIGDNTPAVSGTSEAGASVAVSVDSAVVGTVTADSTGAWSYTLTSSQALTDGMHSANAKATDGAGNVSAVSNTNTFRVDAAAPTAPVVVTPANDSLTNDATPDVTGTAESGVSMEVSIDSIRVATVTASGQGGWSYTLTAAQALADGGHRVSAIATDPAGDAAPPADPNTF